MLPLNKRKIKFVKIRKSKTKTNFDNSFQTFSKIPVTETFTNTQNTRYLQPNNHNIFHSNTNTNQNINCRDIKEIDIKYIPNEILSQNKSNRHQRNKIRNNIPIKTISSFSNDNISDNSFPKYQNNTFTQRTIETYEIPLGKKYCLNHQFHKRVKERENKSMDITYYKPIIYINKNENNNSFCKKSEYSDFFTQNNSFFMNGTNIEDNIPNINLNKTIDYNKENYLRQKNVTTSINSIPRPRKYRKRIPPIPINKINESDNNSFYFEENEIINNNNTNPNYITIKVKKEKNGFSSDKNKLESTKTNTNKKFKNNNKKYSNKTYSIGYIKNIEKIGIQLSFSNNKLKNESIDLISPEILKSLKQYSSEKSEREAAYSDLNMNKVKEFNNNDKNIQIIYNIGDDYEKMRKKYFNKLSCYLLKNKKRRISQKIRKKEKYNIIDIKEKIKNEKRNRSLSNLFKYKKKDIIKESPSATNIKKQDDIGGKVDLKIQNIKNKRYNIRKGIKRKIILTNLIKQCKINKSPQDQGEIIINAAKTIQKWWRDLLYKIFIILNIIKIQSAFRSFITRKRFKENKDGKNNNDNLTSFKKIKNMIYKKIITNSQSINGKLSSINKKSRNSKKLENIISNSSFKIISNEEINSTIKNEEEKNPILIMDKKNLKLCYYTKDYYQNSGEKNIIFIQRYFKNYLNSLINEKNKKIFKVPIIPLSFIEKVKYKNNKNNSEPLIIKPVISISVFTKNNIFLKKKKPVVFSVSKMNYESISIKKETTENLSNDLSDNLNKNNLLIKEEIYQIPVLDNLCYLNKIFINMNDKAEEKINIIQRKFKNILNKREKEKQRIFKKNIILISYISKEFKDNLIYSEKISLIQNRFRQFNKKRKEKENKLILEEKNKKEIQKYEDINRIITKLIENHSINYAFNKLRKAIKLSKEKYFLKMLSQRIKKIINQFVYQKLKLNDINIICQKNMLKKLQNKDNNEIRKSDDNNNIESNDDNDFDIEKDIFFFNTIKRHIKINEIDNNLDSENEIVKLLKETIPDYFEVYPKMNYFPYIKKKNEKNLVNQQIFLFDDDKLAKYIYNCYKIEKNILTITPEIIKKRLILEPLKNQNIFTITRYMDNLYNDYMKNNVCKKCYCKNNELCLSGCRCHNMNNLKFNTLHNKDNNDDDHENNNDKDSLNDNLNINLTINEESSYRDSKKLRNKKLIKYNDRNSFDSNLENFKKFNTYNKDNKSEQKIDNDNLDKNSINTEYNNKNNNPNKINNFIRNFALRKKLRNSTISNLSNISNQNEEIINLNFNLNNKDNTLTIDNFDQSNVYEDDIKLENSNKKINVSLLKKKMKTIEPIPNHVRNLMKKAQSFRNYRKEERKKKKETIKLRDSFVNLDYEYYTNI